MKILQILAVIFICFGSVTKISAEPRRCTSNDTVVGVNEDQNNLMNYLKGTWNVSGSWQVEEGQGKIKKMIRARITGKETFSLILNGHFMKKDFNGRVKYQSRDLDKSIQNSFSAMTIYTFNNNLNKFYSWFYDCSGSFVESNGVFNNEDNHYSFLSTVLDSNRQEVDHMFTMTIVDQDHYKWEVKQRKDSTDTWEVTSSGLSTRHN